MENKTETCQDWGEEPMKDDNDEQDSIKEKTRANRAKRVATFVRLRKKHKEFLKGRQMWDAWFNRTFADEICAPKAEPPGQQWEKYVNNCSTTRGTTGQMPSSLHGGTQEAEEFKRKYPGLKGADLLKSIRNGIPPAMCTSLADAYLRGGSQSSDCCYQRQ